MFDRIIVGVDGSPASVRASEFAFDLAEIWNVPVVGLYVTDARLLEESFLADLAGVLGFTYYDGISSKVREFLEKQGEAVLDEFSARGRERGVSVSVMQTVGVPYREIAQQADPTDLIVVGRVGRKPIRGILIGSNAEKVARHSRCPVAIIPSQMGEVRKALVAFDGGGSSLRAMEICAALKERFGYEVHVLVVEEEEGDHRELKEKAKEILGEDFECHCLMGLPEERIVSFCRENGIDILFLGAYGKGRLKELFLGSVTSFVIHNLEIPMVLGKAKPT
jgi:nucleotide-binding universal stress UspA family protein